jgi:hypothetical protein
MSENFDEASNASSCEELEQEIITEIDEYDDETFETVKNHPKYEISTKYPHRICNKKTGRIMKETKQNKGYFAVSLDSRTFNKHRIIAEQFIPNPNPKEFTIVDHINGDKTDNHIENLRWTTQKKNCRNKHTSHKIPYEFVDVLPEGAVAVDNYSNLEFEFIYYHADKFYFYTGLNYRILRIQQERTGSAYVNTQDINGRFRTISYNKFKREYGLI